MWQNPNKNKRKAFPNLYFITKIVTAATQRYKKPQTYINVKESEAKERKKWIKIMSISGVVRKECDFINQYKKDNIHEL